MFQQVFRNRGYSNDADKRALFNGTLHISLSNRVKKLMEDSFDILNESLISIEIISSAVRSLRELGAHTLDRSLAGRDTRKRVGSLVSRSVRGSYDGNGAR